MDDRKYEYLTSLVYRSSRETTNPTHPLLATESPSAIVVVRFQSPYHQVV